MNLKKLIENETHILYRQAVIGQTVWSRLGSKRPMNQLTFLLRLESRKPAPPPISDQKVQPPSRCKTRSLRPISWDWKSSRGSRRDRDFSRDIQLAPIMGARVDFCALFADPVREGTSSQPASRKASAVDLDHSSSSLGLHSVK